ncbi:TPA: hypothetical protein R1X56_000105 [Campylobacter upsaliensis]|nr:hypothetical protein [Campylobacter upsaliensis]HEC1562350.1 hypothetical protein [Campylobacter upsaliensis]HEC1572787.1 hypothetical protein [Campylobacter upsaliensis]
MKKIKTATNVIVEMANQPHYTPLKHLFYYKDFLLLMPEKHRRHIAKIFIKNDTLNIITLNHIGYQELNHDDSKNYIKILIKLYAKENPNSKFIDVKNLRIFSQRYEKTKPKLENSPKKIRPYIELSLGKFKNPFENKTLYDKFEALRKVIQNA